MDSNLHNHHYNRENLFELNAYKGNLLCTIHAGYDSNSDDSQFTESTYFFHTFQDIWSLHLEILIIWGTSENCHSRIHNISVIEVCITTTLAQSERAFTVCHGPLSCQSVVSKFMLEWTTKNRDIFNALYCTV